MSSSRVARKRRQQSATSFRQSRYSRFWQFGSASGLIPPSKLAAPSAILRAFWTLAVSGALWNDLLVSVGRVALGLVLTFGVGLCKANGIFVGPVLQMLRALPYLGMTPLLICGSEIGEARRLAVAALIYR